MAELQARIYELETLNSELARQNEVLLQNAAVMTAEVQRQGDQITQIEVARRTLQIELDSARSELQQTKDSAPSPEHIQWLESLVHEIEHEKNRHNDEKSHLERRIQELEAGLHHADSEKESAWQASEAANSQVGALQEAVSRLESEVAALTSSNANLVADRAEVESKLLQAESNSNDYSEKLRALSDLELRFSEIANAHEVERTAWITEKTSLESNLDVLRSTIQRIEDDKTDFQHIELELKEQL